MSTTTKQIEITNIPIVDSSKHAVTFGTINLCNQFSTLSSYEIGDMAWIEADGVKTNYRFIKHHNAGDFDSTEVTSTTEYPSSVRCDLSFISNGFEDMSDDTKKPDDFSTEIQYQVGNVVTYDNLYYSFTAAHSGEWTGSDVNQTDFFFSLNNDSKFQDYKFILKGTNGMGMNTSGLLVTARAEDGSRTYRKRTDSNGECVMKFRKDKVYFVDVEELLGYEAHSPSGKTFRLTPIMLNYEPVVPKKFLENWQYRISERVTYNGEYYSFTAAHSGAWNASHASKITIRERETTFYYKKISQSPALLNINLTFDRGSVPVSSREVDAVSVEFGDGFGGTTNASGSISGYVPKNDLIQIIYPSLSSLHLNHGQASISDSTIITGNEKTITKDYDTGLYFVCGSTETSRADGTAWKEFKMEDYPLDDGTWSVGNHPTEHPVVFVHVKPEILSSKRLSGFADIPSGLLGEYDASYYIRVASLTTERGSSIGTNKKWCTVQGTLHPRVTTSTNFNVLSAYDGLSMSYYMSSDSIAFDPPATSPAAEYALSQTETLGDKTLQGFIGTYTQMDCLFKLSDPLYRHLAKFGYSANYKTGTHWWSSCQDSAATAWAWNAGGTWRTSYHGKASNDATVLPFFAVV